MIAKFELGPETWVGCPSRTRMPCICALVYNTHTYTPWLYFCPQ